MFRKDYLRLVLVIVFCLAASAIVMGQTAPVSGKVVLKKADNTTVPVEGALIEVFRTDINGKLPSAKTNKRGEFVFAGVPVGAQVVLSASASGASPNFLANVKAGSERLELILTEGDGKRLTEQEIRAAVAGGPRSGNGEVAKPTEEQKKASADYEAKVREVTAKNEEIKNKSAVIEQSLKAGNAAFEAKNYDLAVSEWNKGIAADPQFPGSAPVLLNNKGTALKIVGIDAYNRSIRSSDPAEKATLHGTAKAKIQEALESFEKSWAIMKTAAAADFADEAQLSKAKYETLIGLTEMYNLAVRTKTNPGKAAESKEAFETYIALETDAAKKAKAQMTYADMMREAGDSENAIAGYRAVLQMDPSNGDAMGGLGLSLFAAGVAADNKQQMQEGLNFMSKYIESSPIVASDSASTKELKQSVKEAVEYLKTEQKLAPQKVSAPARRRN